MVKQLAIENTTEGILPDGTIIKEGDIIMYGIGPYQSQITRVVLFNGSLCMEKNFMYGGNTSISHFLKSAPYNDVKKISLVELYKHCKKNNWNPAEYIIRYGKK